MIQAFGLEAIRQAAVAAGLPAERVIPVPLSDNISIPRPRIEYQVLPARYRRTGRRLGIIRGGKDNPVQTTKWELYEVDLDIQVNALAPDTKKDDAAADAWLSALAQAFVTAFPRGGNDAAGNYVRIRVQRAAYARRAAPQIGEKAVRVFTRIGSVFVVSFGGRITSDRREDLLTKVNINLPEIGKG